MNVQRIDHTAIVVADMDEALERYYRLLGARPSERLTISDQHVEIAFLPIGDTQLELVRPTTTTSGVARFLHRRGEGLHHLGLRVSDIAAELRALEATGIDLIDREPRDGAHGRVAFIHPRSTGGILIELVERSQPKS